MEQDKDRKDSKIPAKNFKNRDNEKKDSKFAKVRIIRSKVQQEEPRKEEKNIADEPCS